MIPLTKDEYEWHYQQKICYICKKIFKTGDDNKKYHKVKDHCYYTGKYRGAKQDIKHQNKFLEYFIMVLHMIIIL